MKKKYCLIPLLISPLLSGCDSTENKGSFLIGNYDSSVIELDINQLSAKMDAEQATFFLAVHKGDSCTCWTGFQYVIDQYNKDRKASGEEYLPFYAFDSDLMPYNIDESFKVDRILSGYVDFYVFVDGQVEQKYSKSAKKDLEMFENKDKFADVVEKHIKDNPIKNLMYVPYEYVRDNLINKNNNEFVLFTIRSECRDCIYMLPNVVLPFLKDKTLKIPCYIVDIDKYKSTSEYETVKDTLCITNKNALGYGVGYVPTYQYWKNGQLVDAGVYANETFVRDAATNKIVVSTSYFDGTRDLKYTNVNLLTTMNKDENLQVNELGEKIFMETKIAAVYHDPLIKAFLSYYCL